MRHMPLLCPRCHTDQVMKGGKTKVHIGNTTSSRQQHAQRYPQTERYQQWSRRSSVETPVFARRIRLGCTPILSPNVCGCDAASPSAWMPWAGALAQPGRASEGTGRTRGLPQEPDAVGA